MPRFVALLLVAALAGLAPGQSIADDATLEKCTCDLVDPRLTNGASVRNATACWSTENENTQWCDIAVKAIEGDGRAQMIINELGSLHTDPSALSAYLLEQAESAFDTHDRSWVATLGEAQFELPEFIWSFSELAAECIDRFLEQRETQEPVEPFEEGPFSCRVGELTGWLRMTFRVGDIRFVFMVAPDA